MIKKSQDVGVIIPISYGVVGVGVGGVRWGWDIRLLFQKYMIPDNDRVKVA